MSYKVPAISILIALLSLQVALVGAVTTRPNLQVTGVAWGSIQLPAVVQPGDQSQSLMITISNLGNKVAYHAEALLALQYPFSYPLAEPGQNNTIDVTLGVIQILANFPVRYVLDIDPSARSGIYRLNLRLTYSDDLEGGTTYDETITIDIPVTGYSSLTASKVYWGSSAIPMDVQPGDDNQPLSITIVNTGTAIAQNVTASLIIERPFTYRYSSGGKEVEAANETSSVGSIMAGGSGLAQFILSIDKDASPGLYRLRMAVRYLRNAPIQLTVDIPVRGYNDMALQKVSIVPAKIYPGNKNVDLKVFVTNAGNAAAKNVSVEVLPTPYVRPSWGGAESSFIGTVQPGQIVPVDFYIDVDELAQSPGNYSLMVRIVYGPTRNKEKLEEVPLFLSAKARFVVTSTKIPDAHVSDTGLVLQVTFRNNGTEEAQGIRVEVEVPNAFSGTMSDYLGTMEPGAEKTATFVLDVDTNAKVGSYVLNQRLSWSQTGATQLFTQDLSLELNVQENPLTSLLPSITISLLVIIAAVIIVAVARRRSHSSKMQPRQT